MPESNQDATPDLKETFNIALWAMHIMALPLEVLWHHSFGKRYFGASTFFAFVWFYLFNGFADPASTTRPLIHNGYVSPMTAASVLFLVGFMVHRYQTFKMKLREHSHYSGRPWLCDLFPGLSEQVCKTWIAPFLSACLAILLWHLMQPFAKFLLLAATSMNLKYRILFYAQGQKEQDMEDAYLTGQYEAERFRQRQQRPGHRS